MEIFGHKLSNAATGFVEKYSTKLDKPVKYLLLPDNHPNFGAMDNDDEFYVVGVRSNVPSKSFEATFCHELYHAFQFSFGFPIVVCNDKRKEDVDKFAENLRSSILDLSADDAVRAHGVDDSFVMKRRYKALKDESKAGFPNYNNQFMKDILAVCLLLDFHSISENQKALIVQSLDFYAPDVLSLHRTFQAMLDEHGYKTPRGCLNVFGCVLDEIGLWKHCHIIFENRIIISQQDLEALLSSGR